MTYQPKPIVNGVYRIKVLNQDLFIESDPGTRPGLKLTPRSALNNKQKWTLTRIPGETDVWTMFSVNDNFGVTSKITKETYWGHGFPYPQSGPSQKWSIVQRTSENFTFSKIKLAGNSDCFDSCNPGYNAIHFYYDHTNASDGPKQCYVFEFIPGSDLPSLEIMFIQDFTGSQDAYIKKARDEIGQVCTQLIDKGQIAPNDLRFGLIAFRDHPPQDNTFVTNNFPFTSDPSIMAKYLSSFPASGGGDGPEAQSDALSDALNAPWKDSNRNTKIVVLVTDAPPHGIGEDGDGFPDGCPLQIDPLRIAARMARVGITLYVIACEPTLSRYYKKARGFYEGLVRKTGGRVIELGDTATLTNSIIGAALEAHDSNAYVDEHRAAICKVATTDNLSAAIIAQKLHTSLTAEAAQHYTLVAQNMYGPNEGLALNSQIWFEAETLADGRAKIRNPDNNQLLEDFAYGGPYTTSVERTSITLTQVQSVVHKSLLRV